MLRIESNRLTIRSGSIYLAAALLLMLTTATNIGPFSSRFGPYYLLFLIGMCALVFVFRAKDVAHLVVSRAFLLGGAFHAALVLAAIFSRNGRELELIVPIMSGLFIYAASAWFASQLVNDRPRFHLSIGVPLLVATLVNVYEYVYAPNVLSTAPGRAAGFFENPNNSGSTIAGLWGLWLISRPVRSWVMNMGFGGLALAAILMTFSRSALLTFFVITLLGAGIFARREGKSILPGIGFAIALGVLAILALQALVAGMGLSMDAELRAESLLTGFFGDESVLTRRLAAQNYWNIFLEHPFVGAGPFGSLTELDGWGPHNAFLAVAGDFGMVGLLAYLSLFVVGLRDARRGGWSLGKSSYQLMLVAWLAVSSLFSHNVVYSPQGSMMIGLLLGSVAASRWRPDRDRC